jgi:hypothetical protein
MLKRLGNMDQLPAYIVSIHPDKAEYRTGISVIAISLLESNSRVLFALLGAHYAM